jgi:phage terminase small subunit
MKTDNQLTDKQEKFCQLYVEHYNGMKAYMEAYPNVKSEASAKSAASRLLNNVNVQDFIEEIKTDFSKLCGITVVSQVRKLQEIVNDEDNPIRVRLDAMKEINKLLGLYPTEKKRY